MAVSILLLLLKEDALFSILATNQISSYKNRHNKKEWTLLKWKKKMILTVEKWKKIEYKKTSNILKIIKFAVQTRKGRAYLKATSSACIDN
jgi:hypothetical protein